MNNWIGPTVKHVWNDTVFAQLILFGFVINTTALPLGAIQPSCTSAKELHAEVHGSNPAMCKKIKWTYWLRVKMLYHAGNSKIRRNETGEFFNSKYLLSVLIGREIWRISINKAIIRDKTTTASIWGWKRPQLEDDTMANITKETFSFLGNGGSCSLLTKAISQKLRK